MLKRRNQKKPFKVLDLDSREEVGDDVITPYEALRSCIYSFIKEEGLTYYYDSSHKMFNVQGVGVEVTFNYGPEYFETHSVTINGVSYSYKNIIEIRSRSSNFSMDITFSIDESQSSDSSMISFITGPRQMTKLQYDTLKAKLEDPGMYNYNGLEDFYRKDIGSVSNSLRTWTLRYLHFLVSVLQSIKINSAYYIVTDSIKIIDIGNNTRFATFFQSIAGVSIYTIMNDLHQLINNYSYFEYSRDHLEKAINQFLFTTEYSNGKYIYNHDFQIYFHGIMPRYVYQTNQDQCSVTIPEFINYIKRIGYYYYKDCYIDNFGNITVGNINELGPCLFHITELNFVQPWSDGTDVLRYLVPTSIDSILMVIESLNNPTTLNGKKLINWRVKQAYICKDTASFSHVESLDQGKELINIINTNILTIKWLNMDYPLGKL